MSDHLLALAHMFGLYFYIQDLITCPLLIVSIPDRSVVYQALLLY